MNPDAVFEAMNRQGVDYLLIGGMNFLLRHDPVTTYDVDLWIDDQADNRRRCERALGEMEAEWGLEDADWGPVSAKPAGWLDRRGMFCFISPHGAVDVFRAVEGLADWSECRQRAILEKTVDGTPYYGLSDEDMLRCQMALREEIRNKDRVARLHRILKDSGNEKS